MNPSLPLLLVVALLCACGRTQIAPGLSPDTGWEEPRLDAGQFDAGPPVDRVIEVSVGDGVHCTRSQAGRVECEATGADGTPIRFTVVELGAIAISVGGWTPWCSEPSYACALMEGGRVVCEASGGSCSKRHEAQIDRARTIAVGGLGSCALIETGEVVCFEKPVFTGPVRVVGAMQGAVAIACGDWSCCGLMADGGVSCLDPSVDGGPSQIPLPAPAIAVTVGGGRACTLDANGHSYCWGSRVDKLTPTGSARAISVGSLATCALDAAGVVQCFTSNGTITPFTVPLVQLSVGYRQVCGLEKDGTLHCADL